MTNFPNGVASFGMPLFPATMGLPLGGGTVVFVDSGYTGGSVTGSFDRPYTTLEAALNGGKVKASNGDIIYLKPGHAESVASATAINLDLAGVSIIGLGVGTQRPTFTFTTATTSTIPVTAADILIANVVFSANFDSVAAVFTLTAAANFTLRACEFKDASVTNVSFVNIVDTSTTDNAADGLTVVGCKWYSEDDATGAFIKADATIQGAKFLDNQIVRETSTVAGVVATVAADKQLANVLIANNYVKTAATVVGTLVLGTCATSSGFIARNAVQSADVAGGSLAAAVTTPFVLVDNWVCGDPATPRAINSIGTIFDDS